MYGDDSWDEARGLAYFHEAFSEVLLVLNQQGEWLRFAVEGGGVVGEVIVGGV